MYTVIGTTGCGKCNQVKKQLEKQKILYTYVYFEQLSTEEQDKYLKIAKMNNIQSFPLIFDDSDNLVKEI